ncbi:MAG: 4-alpha-glucanotransferase [Desulfobulbus propionicus]|nr:MAG: 4-alpha-glucanotransferase [Desulfobulbus propionicus]
MAYNKRIKLLAQRSSGILLPIFSLPGRHGIGDIGESAELFINFLAESAQQWWQILPCGPTDGAFAFSPYMSFSAFAGNPLLISLDKLARQGLLSRKAINYQCGSEYSVDYPAVAAKKLPLLYTAWQEFQSSAADGILEEFSEQQPWVKNYSLFCALKKKYALPWTSWPDAVKKRSRAALKKEREELAADISCLLFEQFIFYSQWQELRACAEKKNIRLIGDVPIYVAADSADVWSNQNIYKLNKKTSLPAHVAGVPPDYFSKSGQLWGNPLYKWNTTCKETKSALWLWWEKRLRHNFSLANAVRIDHFRGFESCWSVPATEKTAVNGKWVKGPGASFFEEMHKRLGNMEIIAEDLGIITPEVERLRDSIGAPGMKILLFAFDGSADNSYLPHNHVKNCVVYTGTHDNDTAVGWYLNPAIPAEEKKRAKRYANQNNKEAGIFHRDLLHLAYSSVADLVIIPMQDVLGFGNDCRINTPGTVADNWQWRCARRFISAELASWLKDEAVFFNRA